jgi:hypothetical protein
MILISWSHNAFIYPMTATREVRTRADWNRHHLLALNENLSHVTKGVNCLRESQATLQTKFAESTARIEKGVDTVQSLILRLNVPQAATAKNDCKATVLLFGSEIDGAASLCILCPEIYRILLPSEPDIPRVIFPEATFWLLSQLHALLADVWAGEVHELATLPLSLYCSRSRNHWTAPSDGESVRQSSSWNMLSPTVRGDIRSHRTFPRSLTPVPFAETAVVEIDISTGKLFIIVKKEFTEVGRMNLKGVISVGRFLFVPAMDSSLVGIAAVFVRCIGAIARIPRTLSTFGVQPDNSPIFEYLKGRDMAMVRNMLSEKRVSPNDRDESGNSLLWVKVFTTHILVKSADGH